MSEDYVQQYLLIADKIGNDIITWARPEGWPSSPSQVS